MVPSPDPHASRSALETALCSEMRAQGVDHEHRSLHFRVQLAGGGSVRYDPDLVVRRGSILFLVEPLEAPRDERSRLGLLAAFLEQHSPEIVLVVVAPPNRAATLPSTSYDEVYPSDDLSAVVRRMREQDPRGIVRPFPKPKG